MARSGLNLSDLVRKLNWHNETILFVHGIKGTSSHEHNLLWNLALKPDDWHTTQELVLKTGLSRNAVRNLAGRFPALIHSRRNYHADADWKLTTPLLRRITPPAIWEYDISRDIRIRRHIHYSKTILVSLPVGMAHIKPRRPAWVHGGGEADYPSAMMDATSTWHIAPLERFCMRMLFYHGVAGPLSNGELGLLLHIHPKHVAVITDRLHNPCWRRESSSVA
jgi:hypothetical protein